MSAKMYLQPHFPKKKKEVIFEIYAKYKWVAITVVFKFGITWQCVGINNNIRPYGNYER